jgi:photosystem II stability/assembly factor-like uncharacterized protein
MAKAGLLYIGTDDGMYTLSDPGGSGRWRQVDHTLQDHWVCAVLPLDALTLLAATSPGVQHSTNGGQSWQHVLPGEEARALSAHADNLAIVYAVMGGGSIQRSADGGQSWQEPAALPPRTPAAAPPLIRAGSPPHLLAAMDDCVWFSNNAGDQWQQHGDTLPAIISALAGSPAYPDTLFVIANGQVYRMQGAGSSWEPAAPVTPQHYHLAVLAVLPGKPETVLAVEADGITGDVLLLYSDDDGTSWQRAAVDRLQGTLTVIAPVSHHRDQAWAGTDRGQVLFTADRGRTWQQVTQGFAPVRSLAPARLA